MKFQLRLMSTRPWDYRGLNVTDCAVCTCQGPLDIARTRKKGPAPMRAQNREE